MKCLIHVSLIAGVFAPTYSFAVDKTGTNWNDNLVGSSENDRLIGKSGNDTLTGLGGADFLNGQSGDDYLKGDGGNDQLYGELGDDTLYGGSGDDHLDGGKQNDKLYGEAGNDTLIGGNFEDILDGGTGDDSLRGDIGHDVYYFKPGYGKDVIDDGDSFFVFSDKLEITNLSTADYVYAKSEGDSLFISINGEEDTVKINNWYTTEDNKLNFIVVNGISYDPAEIESYVITTEDLIVSWINGASFNEVLMALNPNPAELPTTSEFQAAWYLTNLRPGPFQSYDDVAATAGVEAYKLIDFSEAGNMDSIPPRDQCLTLGTPQEICQKFDISK